MNEHSSPEHVGHDAANLGDADTVIHTGAIWPETIAVPR